MNKMFGIILVGFGLISCKGEATKEIRSVEEAIPSSVSVSYSAPQDEVENENSIEADEAPQVDNRWQGRWIINNLETKKTVMEFEFKSSGDGLEGEYKLTPNFCQDTNPEFPSYCPFSGSSGRFERVDVGGISVISMGEDPFLPETEFTLTLITLDGGETVSNVALLADAGRLSVAGELIRR